MIDRQPMSSIDTAWLRMERPTNLMMVTSVFVFQQRISFAQVYELVKTRFLNHPRFKQKPVQEKGSAYWETDSGFDITRHVHRTALPGKADKEELEELTSDLVSTPLDFSKPLWQFHFVENYANGSALISRIHHSYADGLALVQILLSMTDSNSRAYTRKSKPRQPAKLNLLQHIYEPSSNLFDTAFKLSAAWWTETSLLLRNPAHAMDYVHTSTGLATELAKMTSLSDDLKTQFKRDLGVSKKVAWTQPLKLDEIKAAGYVLECTINDVLLSCVAGAFRTYLKRCGDDIDDLRIRAVIPVNLKPPESAGELGNQFGLVFVTLPLDIANPVVRLSQIHRSMGELKQSYQAVLSFILLSAIGMGPEKVQEPVLDLLSDKASAVITNVPGPQAPLYMAGSKIDEIMFWAPQAGHIGIGVSILSYDGHVQLGLMADTKLVNDPHPIAEGFTEEFEKLMLAIFLRVPHFS